MVIRRAVAADAAEICLLHKASIRELCGRHYSAEEVSAWSEPLQPDRYLPAMQELEFFVAERDGIVGFCIVNLKEAELNAIYIHPDASGQGIGRELLEFAQDLARSHSLSRLKVRSTLNSVGFYEACGFSQVCEAIHRTPSGLELRCIEMTMQF